MASAAFTVNGSAVPPEVAVSALSTVTLALVSVTGVRTIEWSIVGNHAAAAVNPTITPSTGNPATFTMPSGGAQAYLVQCKINGGVDETGQAVTDYIKRALVGVLNSDLRVPFAVGETTERSATHGTTEALNSIGGGSLPAPGTAGNVLTSNGSAWTSAAPTASGGAGIPYNFDSSTTDADPGTGDFRLNHATPASATAIYIDDVDANGNDRRALIASYDDSPGTVKGYLTLQDASDEDSWIVYSVGGYTSATGYGKLTGLTVVDVSDNFAAFSGEVLISFDGGQVGTIPVTALTPTTPLHHARVNAAGTAWESYAPDSFALGSDLTDASVTINVSQGSSRKMPAGTTTTARTITVGTTGTPETDENIEIVIYAQGHNVIIANGGPLANTLYTIVAGTKRVVHVQWDGVNWAPAGIARLN